MRVTAFLFTVALFCFTVQAQTASAPSAATSTAQNGAIVEQGECWKNPSFTYEQYISGFKGFYVKETEAAKSEGFQRDYMSDVAKRLLNKEDFEQRSAFAGFECQRVKYMSDGLKVVGIIWKPKETAGKRLPLLIYNRGGNREFGKLSSFYNYFLYPFLQNGFVVIGTQYRGVDGGEGKEEFGGAEIDDVTNLIPLAKSLGYVDMNNVFMLGDSRGGMETLIALKNKFPVNAAAVAGAPTDLVNGLKRRPGFVGMFKEVFPDYETRSDELLRERSAIYWADKINTPLLILQGGADWRTDPGEALSLAQKLQALDKRYEMIIYAGDEHALSLNRADADRRIVEWFKKYMR